MTDETRKDRSGGEGTGGDETKLKELKKISLSVANSITLRLLEKRFLSHESAPETLIFLSDRCLSLLLRINPQGYPGLRMAGDITSRLIEAGRVSSKEAAALDIEERLRELDSIAEKLPPEHKKEILKISSDMVLKMLETIVLSGSSIPQVLDKVARSAAEFMERKEVCLEKKDDCLEKKEGKDPMEKKKK